MRLRLPRKLAEDATIGASIKAICDVAAKPESEVFIKHTTAGVDTFEAQVTPVGLHSRIAGPLLPGFRAELEGSSRTKRRYPDGESRKPPG
jgi:hypothetical protein